jgi:hypothetical protein
MTMESSLACILRYLPIYYNGRYTTYRCIDKRNRPPLMEEIVSSILRRRKDQASLAIATVISALNQSTPT